MWTNQLFLPGTDTMTLSRDKAYDWALECRQVALHWAIDCWHVLQTFIVLNGFLPMTHAASLGWASLPENGMNLTACGSEVSQWTQTLTGT